MVVLGILDLFYLAGKKNKPNNFSFKLVENLFLPIKLN